MQNGFQKPIESNNVYGTSALKAPEGERLLPDNVVVFPGVQKRNQDEDSVDAGTCMDFEDLEYDHLLPNDPIVLEEPQLTIPQTIFLCTSITLMAIVALVV